MICSAQLWKNSVAKNFEKNRVYTEMIHLSEKIITRRYGCFFRNIRNQSRFLEHFKIFIFHFDNFGKVIGTFEEMNLVWTSVGPHLQKKRFGNFKQWSGKVKNVVGCCWKIWALDEVIQKCTKIEQIHFDILYQRTWCIDYAGLRLKRNTKIP